MYYYLFYKLYKFWEVASTPKFWSDAKAVLSINILELFIVTSLIAYYRALVKSSHFGNGVLEYILIVLIILVFNYFIFYSRDQWKKIISAHDQYPVTNHKKYDIILSIMIVAIVTNFIFSFYLFFKS